MRLSTSGAAPEDAWVWIEATTLPSLSGGVSQALQFPTAALERSGKPFLAARELWTTLAGRLPQRPTLAHFLGLGQSAPRTLGMLPRLLDPEVWGPWGLLDAQRALVAVGSSRVSSLPAPDDSRPQVVVERVRADAVRRKVTAHVSGGEAALRNVVLGIMLVEVPRPEETGPVVPEPIDYTSRTTVHRDADGLPDEVVLEIPLTTALHRPIEAWILADLEVIWQGPLTSKG